MTNPPDPSTTYDLYLQLRKLGEQHGYWPGTGVVDIVSNWLKAQGLNTDPHHEITEPAWISRWAMNQHIRLRFVNRVAKLTPNPVTAYDTVCGLIRDARQLVGQ